MSPTTSPNSREPQSSPAANPPTSPIHRASFEHAELPSPRSPRPPLDTNVASVPHRLDNKGVEESPGSAKSGPTFSQLSRENTVRVFPIRSAISVDPTPTPLNRPDGARGEGFSGFMPPPDAAGYERRRSDSLRPSPVSAFADDQTLNTPRTETQSRPDRSISKVQLFSGPGAMDKVATPGDESLDAGSTSAPNGRGRTSGRVTLFSDATCPRSESIGDTDGAMSLSSSAASIRSTTDNDKDSTSGLFTSRFKHVITEGGHAVITGRDGDTLQRCEDEPIHIPGAVQGFGLLLALHEEAEGRLTVRIASENSKQLIGYTPQQLFALDSFCDILSEEQADNLLDHLDFIRDEEADPATNGPEVFTLSIRSPRGKSQKLWCAMHINDRNPDLIICEFEIEDDRIHPLVPADEATTQSPEDTLQSNPTAEDFAESTVNISKPLRVLRNARKRKGEAAAMEVFNIMAQVQEQLANAPNLEKFLKVLVGVVKELTGFHRVMIYQFDQAWNGRVVTELVDPRATTDLYKGLNFPASDIPRQARELYKINKVRLLYDRDLETARLVCRTVEDLETPLDLTYAYLRAMSPIHIKYLANMAVRASMSISINAFNELWGLIACHAYGSKGMRVSFPIRKMCRLVGDSASRNIERLSYASRLQARKLINTAPTEQNPSGYIIASSDDLLKLFDADYGLLSIRDETKTLGNLEQTQEALAMLEYLRLRKITSVMSSQDIRSDFPDLRYPPGFSVIAGLLLVPLSTGGNDFIVFFRKGQVSEVKWAGNPYEKFMKEGTEGYLEPRKSFKTWSETITGKCREWNEDQIETGAVLCLVYGKFIEVWRQKEAAMQNSQLTRLLLANSAHEVRTPLNAIINYLEIALEGSLDQETRDNLARSHSASKSLVYVINDLLDLTKTEEGHNLIKDEIFDLLATAKEAADIFMGEAKRKHIDYEFIEHQGVPQLVIGDQRRVRQVISNVTANAIQHTEHGSVKVELQVAEWEEGRVEIDIVIQDTGVGMSAIKLDALFRDLEQVQTENDLILEDMAPDARMIDEGKEHKRALGLGLAIVARLIRNMNGQLRLRSEEGKGSRFVIQLGFDLPANNTNQGILTGPKPEGPPAAEGEVMLVHKSAHKDSQSGHSEVRRKTSAESMNSMNSFKSRSSSKSGVDRLIDAISEPRMSNKAPSRDQRLTRSASKGNRDGASSAGIRPSTLSRAESDNAGPLLTTTESTRSPTQATPGQATVTDSKTPVKPVRMPEESTSPTKKPSSWVGSKVLSETPDEPAKKNDPPSMNQMRVLVAEDDPINSKIIKKRLEKINYDVYLTVNGEECASAYGDKHVLFDVVLMDMQMPIVDGLTSTKIIRSHEKSHSSKLSPRAMLNGRVPIFAVSASLVERDRQNYIDAGFDGWILKPIDFKRLNVLLAGITEDEVREGALYQPGQWERGGWFTKRQLDVFAALTAPSGKPPVAGSSKKYERILGDDLFDDPISREQARLDNLDTDAVNADSSPQNSGHSGDIRYSGLTDPS